MTAEQLEQRLEAVEQELAKLKEKLEESGTMSPWWERIAGTFHDDSIYKKAMKLGHDYRKSLRAESSGRKQK